MTKRKSIVYLGNSGFPYGLAEVQKMTLIAKSLIRSGNTVTVICKKGIHNKKNYPDLKESGNFQGIDYVYASGTPYRDESFIKRNLLKLKGSFKEILVIRQRRRDHKLDFAILSTNKFFSILIYVFLSKVYRFKIILNYAEFYPAIKKAPSQIGKRLNSTLYDKYAPFIVDAVFPISEFLINHLKKISPGIKYLKIPVLTDVEKYNDVEIVNDQKYFLFCGDAGYKEIIRFIIDSFWQLNTTSTFLYLVINGDENNIKELKEYINGNSKKDYIKLLSRLSEKQLYSYYKNAVALLIPLRPTLQDSARFPHKIGEYLASGNPVISTNYGEVRHYFKDKENMLIADSYDVKLFANKMQFAIDNPKDAQEIGINGKNIVLRVFDYRVQASLINTFLDSEFYLYR